MENKNNSLLIVIICILVSVLLLIGGFVIGKKSVNKTDSNNSSTENLNNDENIQKETISNSEIETLSNIVDDLETLDYFNRNIDENNKLSDIEVNSAAWLILKNDDKVSNLQSSDMRSTINKYFGEGYKLTDVFTYDSINCEQCSKNVYDENTDKYTVVGLMRSFGRIIVLNRVSETESYKVDNKYYLTVYKAYGPISASYPSKSFYIMKEHDGWKMPTFDGTKKIESTSLYEEIFSVDDNEEILYIDGPETTSKIESAFAKIENDKLMKTQYVFELVEGNYIFKSLKYLN